MPGPLSATLTNPDAVATTMRPAVGRELHGVGEQVRDRAVQAIVAGVHARWLRIDVDRDALGTRVRARGLHALVNAVVKTQNFDDAVRTFAAREFAQVGDEGCQLVDLGDHVHR